MQNQESCHIIFSVVLSSFKACPYRGEHYSVHQSSPWRELGQYDPTKTAIGRLRLGQRAMLIMTQTHAALFYILYLYRYMSTEIDNVIIINNIWYDFYIESSHSVDITLVYIKH